MPNPRKNEKKSEYVSRCVKEVMKEGKTQKEALGQCYGMWENHKKDSSACAILSNGEEIILIEGV